MRPFHPLYILTALPKLLWPYFLVTLEITVLTVIFGSAIGMFIAFLKLKKNKVAHAIGSSYIYIVRCVPPIILLFIVFYGLPFALQQYDIDIEGFPPAFFVVVTLTILFSASAAEVFRSAYLAIDFGQTEAALSVGMTKTQAMIRIVAPQAVSVALPNFANSLVSLLKEGSLAYTIGLIDMMGQGQLIIARNFGAYSLEIYIALGIIYWTIVIELERLFGKVEKHLQKGKKLMTEAGHA